MQSDTVENVIAYSIDLLLVEKKYMTAQNPHFSL